MKVVAQKVWTEPAVFIGLLASIAMTLGAILTGSDWTWETIVAVSAPFVTTLGVRPLVKPATHSTPTMTEAEATERLHSKEA